MNRFELYPSRIRLVLAAALGVAMLVIGQRLWLLFSTQSDGPSVAWLWPGLFLLFGGIYVLRAGRSLVQPRPCFAGNAKGFSVMGNPARPWADYARVSVGKPTFHLIPWAQGVSLSLRADAHGRVKHLDIPWTHLPASAHETAHRIEKLAEKAKRHNPAPPPTYDPYNPAALALARARAT